LRFIVTVVARAGHVVTLCVHLMPC